jgi:AcrR family transcriptional regulator
MPALQMQNEKRGRGRPRRAGADEAILVATRKLLDEVGYAALTIDVIAERTGIAKTTIYRRWPTKGALVSAAIDVTPSTSDDPITLLRETAELLTRLAGADVEVLRAVLEPRRALLGPRADLLLGALLTRFVMNEPLAIDDLIRAIPP